MTNEELVSAIQHGEYRRLELWEQIRHLVAWYALRWQLAFGSRHDVELDDLLQSGWLAMESAAITFDGSKGGFAGWLLMYLKKEFAELYGLRGARDPLNGARSLDEPIFEEDEATLADTIADPRDDYAAADDRIWTQQLHAELEKALDGLPARTADVIRRRYFDGEQQEQIAADLGISGQRCHQLEREGLRAIRRKHGRALEEFSPFRGTGLTAFQNRGSVEEAYLIWLEQLENCGKTTD